MMYIIVIFNQIVFFRVELWEEKFISEWIQERMGGK